MVECHVWIPWFCLFPSQTNSKYLDHRGHRSHVVKGEWERKYSKAQVRPLPGQSLNNVSGSLSCLYNLDPVLGNPHFLVIGTKMLFSSKHDLSTHTLHKVGLDKENIVLLKRWSNSRANISCWTDMKMLHKSGSKQDEKFSLVNALQVLECSSNRSQDLPQLNLLVNNSDAEDVLTWLRKTRSQSY